jgi:FixJ family two-component response regulator
MNGIELHRHLVANHCEISVVFITAHGSEEGVRSQAFQNGAVDFLIKPLSEDTVLNGIHKALSAKRHTQG